MTETIPTTGTLDDPAADPFEIARQAAAVIADRSGSPHHDVALVLGSGWGQTGDLIGDTLATIDNAEVPGFAKVAVRFRWSWIRTGVPGAQSGFSPPQPLVSTMVRQPAAAAVRTPCTTAATPRPS